MPKDAQKTKQVARSSLEEETAHSDAQIPMSEAKEHTHEGKRGATKGSE